MHDRSISAGAVRVVETAEEILNSYKCILRRFAAYAIRTVALIPLAIGCRLALISAGALSFADRLEGLEETKAYEEHEELVIPAPVLYEVFDILISHGKRSKEWIVALGAQELDGKLVITRVYDINCAISHATGAEVDYSSLGKALRFYEKCGYQIAGLAHIHPWNSETVSPSATDIKTHRQWEELYKGRFIGIVFNNSGVFRIFHGGKCKVKPKVVGKGVRMIGKDLYRFERDNN
jgi:hypothetical protein